MTDGEWLKKLRKDYKLKQSELGALCGISASIIAQVEQGKRRLTDKTREKIEHETKDLPFYKTKSDTWLAYEVGYKDGLNAALKQIVKLAEEYKTNLQ